MSRILFAILLLAVSCHSGPPAYKLAHSEEEIVRALVELYSANAALQLNDIVYRDSTAALYYRQVEQHTGITLDALRPDLELLLQYPDSLIKLENRALDTIRILLESHPSSSPLIIGNN